MQTYPGKRVAFLHHQLGLGGSERVSYDAACYLETLGIESFFITNLFDKERWLNAEAKLFPVIQFPKLLKNISSSPENIEAIVSAIKEHNIEVLFVTVPDKHLHNILHERTNCQVVWWIHNMPYFEAFAKIESYRAQGERYPLRRLAWHVLYTPLLLWGNRYVKSHQKKYRGKLEGYDASLVLVQSYKDQIVRDLKLSPDISKKIFVKTNCLEIEEQPQLKKEKVITYMGRLVRSQKRIDRLMKIWAMVQHELPDWRLELYGTGGEKEYNYLQALAQRLGLVRYEFMGFTPNPQEIYRSSAIMAMTSSYEGVPVAVCEAQNQGVVPIAFNCCEGVAELLSDGGGVLVDAVDMQAYARELIRLAQDTEYYNQLQTTVLQKRELYNRSKVDAREWQAILAHLFPNPA